jgi:hypothetical protein
VFGKVAEDNRQRLARISETVELRRRNSESLMGRLQQSQSLTTETVLLPFFEYAVLVKEVKLPDPGQLPASQTSDLLGHTPEQRPKLKEEVLRAIGSAAAGAGAGGAIGAGAGFLAYSATAAIATASTGAAISGLSGAAATSATLAWLGGGSLAVWGMV